MKSKLISYIWIGILDHKCHINMHEMLEIFNIAKHKLHLSKEPIDWHKLVTLNVGDT